MNESEPENRNHVGDHGDDYAAYSKRHTVVRDGSEDLSNHHDVDDSESASNDDVENRAEFCAIEAERVSRGSDLTETKLGQVRAVFEFQCKRRLTFGPRVPVNEVHRAPRIVPTTTAAIDWFRDRPNSGPSMPKGTVPTWQVMDHQRRKTLRIDGGFLSSSWMRSMPWVSIPIFSSSHSSPRRSVRKTPFFCCSSRATITSCDPVSTS